MPKEIDNHMLTPPIDWADERDEDVEYDERAQERADDLATTLADISESLGIDEIHKGDEI